MTTVITLVFIMTELGDPSNGFSTRVTHLTYAFRGSRWLFCVEWIVASHGWEQGDQTEGF